MTFTVAITGRPNVGNRELFDELVDQMFERKWFSNNNNTNVKKLSQQISNNIVAIAPTFP